MEIVTVAFYHTNTYLLLTVAPEAAHKEDNIKHEHPHHAPFSWEQCPKA